MGGKKRGRKEREKEEMKGRKEGKKEGRREGRKKEGGRKCARKKERSKESKEGRKEDKGGREEGRGFCLDNYEFSFLLFSQSTHQLFTKYYFICLLKGWKHFKTRGTLLRNQIIKNNKTKHH